MLEYVCNSLALAWFRSSVEQRSERCFYIHVEYRHTDKYGSMFDNMKNNAIPATRSWYRGLPMQTGYRQGEDSFPYPAGGKSEFDRFTVLNPH